MKLQGNNQHCDYRIRQRSTLTAVLLLLFAVCYHPLAVQSFSPPVHHRPALSRSNDWNTKQPSTTPLYAVRQWGSNIQRVALRILTRRKQRPERKPYQPGRPASYDEEEESNPKNLANRPSTAEDDSTQSTVIIPTNDDDDDETLPNATTTQPPTTHPTESTTTKSTTSSVDLTGSWKLWVNDAFLQQYQEYLTQLGQPFWVRSIALSIVARTTEETHQTQKGESLWIKGTNVRGTWERTLWTTASDATLRTADGETVSYEAWWEGPVHVSWLRGVQKYGGGSFESRRYLNDTNGLVCESTFHPDDANRETARVTWTFVAE